MERVPDNTLTDGQHRADAEAQQLAQKIAEGQGLIGEITEMLKRRAPFNDTIEGQEYERAIRDQLDNR